MGQTKRDVDSAEKAIVKTVATAKLLDAYGVLLTDRQREYLSLFYEEDLSLAEIGEKFSITRQAVHDTIRHGEAQLLEYEDALRLVEKNQVRQETIQKIKALFGNNRQIDELLEQL
jgi:predicted DNA-binding protein YlxM (UPF0122 family)